MHILFSCLTGLQKCRMPFFSHRPGCKFSCIYLYLSVCAATVLVSFSMHKHWNMACMVHISVNWWAWQAFYNTCYCETEGLLGLHILCMVSFLPFGECGQCKFHALPHCLALLYGRGYTVQWRLQYGNDFLLSHPSHGLPLIMIRVSFCGRWCNKTNLFTNTAHHHTISLSHLCALSLLILCPSHPPPPLPSSPTVI